MPSWFRCGRQRFCSRHGKAALAASLLLVSSLVAAHAGPLRPTGLDNATTFQENAQRTGVYPNDWLLSPFLVGSNFFGVSNFYNTDAPVLSQPLMESRIFVPGQGFSNLLYVCSSNNTLYAFDDTSGSVVWKDHFGTPVTSTLDGVADLTPNIGITGTPVIDQGMRTIFVVAKVLTNNGDIQQQLHAINMATGTEMPDSPVVLKGSVAGIGDNSVLGTVAFDPLVCDNRGALLDSGSTIYIPEYDNSTNHGWVLAYNKFNLQQQGVFCTTPNAITNPNLIAGGGVGLGGSGLTADTGGNVYASAGVGDATEAIGSYSDSILHLTLNSASAMAGTQGANGLFLQDFFTPSNIISLTQTNLDAGSGGQVVLPDSMGLPGKPHLMVSMGMNGTLYLLNRDSLGGFQATDPVVAELPNAVPGGAVGAPALANNMIYYAGTNDALYAFSISDPGGVPTITQTAKSTVQFGPLGASPSISGIQLGTYLFFGVVWVADAGSNTVYAFSTSNLTLLNAFAMPNGVTISPYAVPLPIDGQVYIATNIGVVKLGSSFTFAL